MIDFTPFEEKTRIVFKKKETLIQAFTHRSYINENPGIVTGHNERLEFLGDAVLELAVTNFLYKKFTDKPEGELTALRAALVNAITLATAAEDAGMNDYLLLSKGEAKDMGKARQYILANAFEAYIGAVYIDRGYDMAEKFISDTLFGQVDTIIDQKLWRDPKSLIQEKAQEYVNATPSYKVLKESGPDHDKQFVIGIYFGNTLIAEGKGKSKQEAEQKAAHQALVVKKWLE